MYHVAYSPYTSLIALANDAGEITLWDGDDGTKLTVIRGDAGRVTSVAISPDNRLLMCGYGDPARLFMYHIEKAAKIAVIKLAASQVNDIIFARNNRYLLIVHTGITLIDGQSLKTIRTDSEFFPYALAALSADGSLMAISQPQSDVFHVVDSLTGAIIATGGGGGSIQTLAFATNKKSMYVWSGYALKQWKLSNGKLMRVLVETNPADEICLAESGKLSPGGKLLATAGSAPFGALIDTKTGAVLHQPPLGWRTTYDFSPGSKKLLVGYDEGAVLINSYTGEEIRRFVP